MIILKTLRWSNMFSYGEDNFIDFTKHSLTQLVGKNGHGKTSILHILEEILCNKNSKGYKKAGILNRNVKVNWYSGEVTFDIDKVPYEVKAKRVGATQKVTLLCSGKDISQHTATATYDLIEKLFKIDFKTLSQIIGQNSKSSLQFLTSTDTLRKKFLIDLLTYDSYLEEYEKAKEVHKREADKLKTIEAEHKHLSEWVVSQSKINLNTFPIMDEVPYPFELENEIKLLTEEIKKIDSTILAIRKNNQYIEIRDAIPIEVLSENTSPVNLTELKNKEAVLKAQITTSKAKLEKVKKLHGKCHECLQDIDPLNSEKIISQTTFDINYNSAELTSVGIHISKGNKDNERHLKVKKYIEDFEKYSGLIDKSLPVDEPNKEELQSNLTTMKTELALKLEAIRKVKTHNEMAKTHNAKVELIISQTVEIQEKLNKAKENLVKQTELVGDLEILKKASSTNGLVAYKLENDIKDLEELTNQYLEELSDGKFQMFFIINNDKLNVVIKDDGIDVEIEALSTGELSRVTTATLLAIRKLMATLSKSQINLLFLDETLDVLDDEGKEKLIDILVKETDLNTFLISHGYKHPLLQTVSIVKKNKISKLYDY